MKKLLSIILISIIVFGTLSIDFSVMAMEQETQEVTSTSETTSDTSTTISETETTTEATSETEITTAPVVNVTNIALNTKSYRFNRFAKNGTLRLTATVSPVDATNKVVKWTSNNNKIATVDSTGKVTLKSKGTCYITATTTDGSNKSAKCKITILQKVTKVKLNKSLVYINKVGKTATIKAIIYPIKASSKAVKWTTGNKKVAKVVKNSKVKAVGKGYCTIKATAKDGSKKYATCLVVVGNRVKKIKLSKTKVLVGLNSKYKLKATVTPKNASCKLVKWTTSNSSIATVDSTGKVTGKNRGTCYIRATAKDGSRKYATCKVTVIKLVSKVTVSKTKLDLEYGGKSVKLTATVSPADASIKTVTWTSSNTKIAVVNTNGVVTAKGIGTATITATSKDGKKKYATCKVTTTPNLYKKLSLKDFKKQVCIDKYCKYLNDYFESCGATINPKMEGFGQYCVTTVDDFMSVDNVSIYDHAVQAVCAWTWRRAYDAVRNREGWKDITSEGPKLEKYIDDIGNYGSPNLDTYNPKKMMDMEWNGWKAYCEEYKSLNDPLDIYVCSEKVDGGYVIYMYWGSEAELKLWGFPLVTD